MVLRYDITSPCTRCCRISMRGLASLRGIEMGSKVPPPVIVHTSYRKGRAAAADGYYDSCLSTRAVAAVVIQKSRMPRKGVGSKFLVTL
ncbi:hypothetical protein AVEN_36417-1 [Araneus ventricosus]|uniref:Uncharacterized protein n=1 Tax=Araneus ventricosus TaxID=182803 RepID=A0A4Y2QGB4_ARAVE|nr:hypothetical protein AVEN_36417-1 [Araneus ventricosus]